MGETQVTRTSRQTSEAIRGVQAQIVESLVDREFSRHPELERRYGAVARDKSRQDAAYHLAYLAEALDHDSRTLFVDYVAWAKVVLVQRGVLASDLAFHLQCMAEAIAEHLPPDLQAPAAAFIAEAVRGMADMPDDLPTFLDEGTPLSPLAHTYFQALLRGERHLASRLVLDAVEGGMPVKEIYLQVFQPAQYEIGRLWQHNRISVAQEHYCTAATQLIMSQLYPHVFAGAKKDRTLVAACVSGELHEIGARMVADFFEMDGWRTFYTGASTPPDGVIQTVIDRKADLLGISATITYHVGAVGHFIAALRTTAECAGVKVLVGGYPFNLEPGLWQRVGADGWARDAQGAVATAERLVSPDAKAG